MPHVQLRMKHLGFIDAVVENYPEYVGHFKPSTVHHILTPYNKNMLLERLPEANYSDSKQDKNSER